MKVDNWELINGPDAHEIEALNYASQVNVLTGIVIVHLAYCRLAPGLVPPPPNEQQLQELHRAATMFLLSSPGVYRNIEVDVMKVDGTVGHKPMVWQKVSGEIYSFFMMLNAMWPAADPVAICAFSLWAINFIHPFRNGNGRTARAFAYTCLCLRAGAVLPGQPTVIDQLMTDAERGEFIAALSHADETHRSGSLDIEPLKLLIARLLTIQLSSVSAIATE